MTEVRNPPTRRWWAWPILLVSFPLAGLAASLLLGPVTTVPVALAGGVLVGLVFGAAQALAIRTRASRWIPASALGLAAGTTLALLLGAVAPLASPIVQGVVLGAIQALARPPVHPALWVLVSSLAWSIAWAVSWLVAISDEPGFVVFGASGALFFTVVMFAVGRLAARSTP